MMNLTMSDSWLKHYEELQAFVQSNPRLEIADSSLFIPEDLRVEFFRLFDMVRFEVVKSQGEDIIKQSQDLSINYLDAESVLIQALGLEAVRLAPDLQAFLRDPVASMSSSLSSQLFDLLKGKITTQYLKQFATELVGKTFTRLYFPGYIKWIMLSLILQLDPVEAFGVSLESLRTEQFAHWDNREKEVPIPEKVKRINIINEGFVPFLVPDIIIRSQISGTCHAFIAQAGKPTALARQLSERQEWIELEQFPDLKDVILVYSSNKADALSLVADTKHICRPDQVIWVEDIKNNQQEITAQQYDLIQILKPKYGFYRLSRQLSPGTIQVAPAMENIPVDTELAVVEPVNYNVEKVTQLTVGFDAAILSLIVHDLVNISENSHNETAMDMVKGREQQE